MSSNDRAIGMRHQVDAASRPIGDLYITPLQVIEELTRLVRPSGFKLLWDPCASGAAPWTVGEVCGEAWGLPVVLTDLYPRRPGMRSLDYMQTPRPKVAGPIIEASNLPYKLLKDDPETGLNWLTWWRARALPGDASIWFVAYDSLPVGGDRAQDCLRGLAQPRWRAAFWITYEDALATEREMMKVDRVVNGEKIKVEVPRPIVNGMVELEAVGKSHCWIILQKGYSGETGYAMTDLGRIILLDGVNFC